MSHFWTWLHSYNYSLHDLGEAFKQVGLLFPHLDSEIVWLDDLCCLF